jgi:DNA-binding CsgD family transcriptional regulator
MEGKDLVRILELPDTADRHRFLDCWGAIESDQRAFTSVVDLSVRKHFLYVSDNEKSVIGHGLDAYLDDVDFAIFHKIVPPEYLPMVSEKQAGYALEAHRSDFNPIAPQMMTFNNPMKRADGLMIETQYVSVVLEYSTNRDMRLLAGTYQDVSRSDQTEILSRHSAAVSLFVQIKESYVSIFPDRFRLAPDSNGSSTVNIYHPHDTNREAITEREREALQWIAQGLSSKQVAEKMMISFHTAETYRKHLLEKFESKNSAELIKKASRMFWLK